MLKDSVVKRNLNVHNSQSNMPIFEYPLNFKQDCGEPSLQTCQSGMHVDESAVGVSPILHLLSTSLSSVLKRKEVKLLG
jgi:hypothetical protein